MTEAKTVPMYNEGDPWTEELLKRATEECEIIATEELKLDCYPNQLDIISSDQMLDAYTSIGLPVMYQHWSFGKHFLQHEASYRTGMSGLAYEIVINSKPCISYLMENNDMNMQTLVIAHAAFGHNHFFKNNYMFQQWTDAEGILTYLSFAKKYITSCEEKYGKRRVEEILDSCHALMSQGINRYKRPPSLSREAAERREKIRRENEQSEVSEFWDTLIPKKIKDEIKNKNFPSEPQENILYFVEKYSPVLKPWEKEIVRIVRHIGQYFYPQSQTKVMNEGCASFVHYYIMNRLWEKGLITNGCAMDFIKNHCGVVSQPDFDSPYYNGLNPYYLGFNIFMDIKRISEGKNVDDEDREWFPHMVGTDWLKNFHYAVSMFRDESFIQQYLSPKLIRKMKLFSFDNDNNKPYLEVMNIHNQKGYKKIREDLSRQYSISRRDPDIQVVSVDMLTDRVLHLRHVIYDGIELNDKAIEVIKHLKRLWGYDVVLEKRYN